MLHYEQAQTRYIERRGRWYNLSTHLPWIGMRTARLDAALVRGDAAVEAVLAAGNEPARRVAKTKCVHARTSRVLEQRQ